MIVNKQTTILSRDFSNFKLWVPPYVHGEAVCVPVHCVCVKSPPYDMPY